MLLSVFLARTLKKSAHSFGTTSFRVIDVIAGVIIALSSFVRYVLSRVRLLTEEGDTLAFCWSIFDGLLLVRRLLRLVPPVLEFTIKVCGGGGVGWCLFVIAVFVAGEMDFFGSSTSYSFCGSCKDGTGAGSGFLGYILTFVGSLYWLVGSTGGCSFGGWAEIGAPTKFGLEEPVHPIFIFYSYWWALPRGLPNHSTGSLPPNIGSGSRVFSFCSATFYIYTPRWRAKAGSHTYCVTCLL